MTHVVLYAFDTMADWEYAYITTVLQMELRSGDSHHRLLVAGATAEPVTTLGGLRVLPEVALEEVDEAAISLLLLPGGNTWLTHDHEPVLALARRLLEVDTPVAGICGATRAMVRARLRLAPQAEVTMEANPGSVEAARFDAYADEPDYPGSRYRVHASVAHDGCMITAIGEAPLEFSREVFKVLELDDVDEWYAAFKSVPDAR